MWKLLLKVLGFSYYGLGIVLIVESILEATEVIGSGGAPLLPMIVGVAILGFAFINSSAGILPL